MFDAIVDRKIKVNHGYECAYHQRKVDIAKQLFAIMGIAREDTEKQQNWVMRGFRQFDASISIVMTCIAMGWPDFDLADNDAKPVREDNENFVTYTSFE